jgi:carbon-monoxide dehydrogenase medium subunit
MVAETDSGIRVAVTGAGACAFRASDFEAALTESFSADALGSVSIDSDDLNSDLHASAGYRAHLVRVMAVRAVKALGG